MYYRTNNAKNCPLSGIVVTETECKEAANQLAITYYDVWTGNGLPAGGFQFDKSLIYFNTIVDPSATSLYSSSPAGAICRASTGMVVLDIFFKEVLL